jgi:starch synthase
MRILFVASEGLPFSKTGGLADVVEALPKALVQLGHEVAVVLPRYRDTFITAKAPLTGDFRSKGMAAVAKVASPSLTVPMGATLRFPSIGESAPQPSGVRYFFVDDPEYFDREQLYGTPAGDYPDNAERFAQLARAAIETAKQIWAPDVIHCHDWQSALVPVMMRTLYADDPALRGVPVVFTIHNMGYHGLFPKEILKEVGLPDTVFGLDGMEFFGKVNYLKGGLEYSDYLTTVSRKYAEEIQTPEYGHGLDGVVRGRADRLVGILNGVDYSVWSPETDTLIAARYSAKDLSGKQACKKDLLKTFGLPEGPPEGQLKEKMGRPLLGIVSRFADQKGFDLLAQTADTLLHEDLAIVALGKGEAKHEKTFRELAARFPEKLAVKIAYDNTLAHKIEAGADMFLMPSRYEPCGLNQIYSLRYGTVPVVRATGGLDDTIEPFDKKTGAGTGFKFHEYSGEQLLAALHEALAMYRDAASWRRLQSNGMARDFSWNISAGEYVRLYEVARKSRIRKMAESSK